MKSDLAARLCALFFAVSAANAADMQEAAQHIPENYQSPSVDVYFKLQHPPEYPRDLIDAGIGGTVVLRILVDREGVSTAVTVEQTCGNQRLDQAAITAANHWRFNPGRRDGVAIPGIIRVPVGFKAGNGPERLNRNIDSSGAKRFEIVDKARFSEIEQTAKRGEPNEQVTMGNVYEDGIGVKPDPVMAFHWYEKAADQGDERGELFLGRAYRIGLGTEKDIVKSRQIYEKLATAGNPIAEAEIGIFYESGEGTPRDDAAAAKWFLKSAIQGLPFGQFALGNMYMQGRGVPQDDVLSLAWFLLASKQAEFSNNGGFNALMKKMPRESVTEAQDLAQSWKQGQTIVRKSKQ